MKAFALRVSTSAISSSTHSADFPPLMKPMRLIPPTMVWSWPWLGWSLSCSGLALPVGMSPIGWP